MTYSKILSNIVSISSTFMLYWNGTIQFHASLLFFVLLMSAFYLYVMCQMQKEWSWDLHWVLQLMYILLVWYDRSYGILIFVVWRQLYNQAIAPSILRMHKTRYFFCQFRLTLFINYSCCAPKWLWVYSKHNSWIVHDILNPVSFFLTFWDYIIFTSIGYKPDLYSMLPSGFPSFCTQI